jgi:amino acid adenylation domain-containing protein
MIGHYQRVLRAMLANPEQAIDDLDLLDGAERQQVVSDWNATGAAWVPQCVHQQFEAQVTRRPEALALVMGDERLTYADLNVQANRLGWYLRARGVGPEVRVVVCLARSPALVVAQLAILKAGGAYVPLDPAYPTERLRTMIADAGAIVVLSQPEVLDRHPDLQRLAVPVLDLTTIQSELQGFTAEYVTSAVSQHNLAYVIYTSGSTGKPKGVAIEHGSLANLVGWHLASFGVTAADRATQIAGPGFDAAVWEIWPYLAAGAGIEIVPEETRLSAPVLRDWLVAQGSTIAFVPTPVAEGLIGLTWPSPCALRWLLTGGDRLHAYPAADLPFTLVNNYGPTENTVVATSGVVRGPDTVANLAASEAGAPDSAGPAASASAPSIGRPISNVRSYVLDGPGTPVPVGIPGELWLGGSSVARGYLGDPAQTADRFRPDPFGQAPGGRLYRTGDLVRWRAAGDLEFLGRVDDQVKVRGFRIELGEITAALQQHSGVQQAFVAAPRDEQGRPYLAAYVVPQDGQLGDASGLRDFLAARLPDHMLPAAWTFLAALPMTPNGKVDRKALPQPAPPASPGTAAVPPRTALEETVATHWAAVLGLDQVGVFDNFFALGGHSLLAAELVARLRDACHVALPLRALFDAPTVAGLAAKLDGMAGEHAQPASPAVPTTMTSRTALLAQLDDLSDDDVDALLAELGAAGEEWDD